ncbi:MAG: hypothetical protein OIF50_08050, partial [Flavobacteriaceae bacterium]|nr:hypothetical protein [Flavobacteriaceae bacterium]
MKSKMRFKKLLLSCLFVISCSSLLAQQTTGDVTQEAGVDYGTTTTGGSIRVIDNKGTIKFLQSKNGITMLTNTTNDITTTTWQLGGTLTDDTFIDVDGNVFGFNGIELIDTNTEDASTDAITESDAGTGSGYTILVRDEATGAVKKLLATDLIQSGQETFTVADPTVATFPTAATALPSFSQVWVYRNGAKLIANVDYTVATNILTLVPSPGTGASNWSLTAGDL